MEGVTHPVLRGLMAERGGIGVVCTEFVRITSLPLGKKTLAKHVVRPGRGKLSVQVMGRDIEQMADATDLVTQAGADIVDINLGCPAPKAVRKGVGSAMLSDLPLLGRVLSAMRKRTHLPLSAKIRAGLDDATGVLEIAEVVQDSGADFITVHPRRRVDQYRGVADWRIISRLARELQIPVVGNGDVWYAADALRMERETGCSAVMIGRPALRNPFIFRQIMALQAGERPEEVSGGMLYDHLLELRAGLLSFLPERKALGMLKEQLRYVGRAVPDGGAFQKAACRAQGLEELFALLGERLVHLSPKELDLGAWGGSLEQSGEARERATPAPAA
jgi:nifR3 family TIM-barrel protein